MNASKTPANTWFKLWHSSLILAHPIKIRIIKNGNAANPKTNTNAANGPPAPIIWALIFQYLFIITIINVFEI